MTALLVFICYLISATAAPASKTIEIPADGAGRIYEGFGAASAGASSRLLIDYPEPQRSQILDYLFKPNYGASLQHLKVEIGGDANSTDGSEPSHMHTRADLNFDRGYEWWLMKEARKRNPKIMLDTLAWGAPGWIGDGKYYSQDMADYVAKFLQGAKHVHGLDIEFTGVWNEKPYDGAWVKLLRRTLDANGLSTKIVAADSADKKQWEILRDLEKDPKLDRAVFAVAMHYPRVIGGGSYAPQWARGNAKRRWSSEDQPALGDDHGLPVIGSRDWVPGGKSMAQVYNRNYIEGRFTKTEIWSPITSYYDNLAAPNSGLMYANTPWSGHYDVQSTIWVTAHTTQFAQPGWQYVDSACGYLPDAGSYVTLKSPESRDYTVVVETIDAKAPQTVTFRAKGPFEAKPVHVWRSNGKAMFEQRASITPKGDSFTFDFEPDSVYTLSTTTGQRKGTVQAPVPAAFPFPYSDDFEKVARGRTPKYLADQNGAFEAIACEGRPGQCLRQVIERPPISWGIDVDPYTYLGDASWKDYSVAADVMLEGPGQATVIGRIDSADYFRDSKIKWPSSYVFVIRDTGEWELISAKHRTKPLRLASGKTNFGVKRWHRLELAFAGDQIRAMVDGKAVAALNNSSHKSGMAGVGSGWNTVEFDNFSINRATIR